MDFLAIFSKKSKGFYFILIILSFLTSFLSLAMLTLINNTIAGLSIPFLEKYDWQVFVVLIISSFIFQHTFQVYLTKLTASFNFEFELYLLNKLKQAKLQALETLGINKILAATVDIRQLNQLPEILINTIQSVIIIFGCFIYLFWNSMLAGFLTLGLMIGLLIFYFLKNGALEKELQRARELENDYMRHLNDLLQGFKEIKVSKAKNENIIESFLKVNRASRIKIGQSTSIKYLQNELIGHYSWYVVLGFILFLLPKLLELEVTNVSVFLVTIIYIMGPVSALIALVPALTHIRVAVSRLESFKKHLDQGFIETEESIEGGDMFEFDQIVIRELNYRYPSTQVERGFHFGPVSVTMEKGEIIFIQGGNGSGKSTFIKLLCGLYRPDAGEISLGRVGKIVESPDFRDYVSAVFTNPYMFSENYEDYELDHENPELLEYIKLFKMEAKLDLESSYPLRVQLSKGQEKRLAFILALLEHKPILILDEWAAEQDPEFRSYFYTTILPAVKQKGKTIIAVTHDDNYFHVADKLIKFDHGTITHS